jgi:uncharacterized Zn finger protein (UPF0148 family)
MNCQLCGHPLDEKEGNVCHICHYVQRAEINDDNGFDALMQDLESDYHQKS